jgi:aminoglycoside phosphotransferase (APT) family kinase protein
VLSKIAQELSPDADTFRVLRKGDRDRSTVAAVEFDTATGSSQSAWVKIRHERGLAPTVHSQRRPRLTPLPADSSDGASLEFLGLVHTQRAVAGSGLNWMHAVRPLACIPEDGTVVMELVAQQTVKHRLRHLGASARGTSAANVVATIGHRAGRWLREYQSTAWEGEPKPGRPASVAAALEKIDEMQSYLREQGVSATLLGKISARAVSAATESGDPWVLVPCHGDFSPRNVLYRDPGDLWVIDPMPRWSVPPWEDLARFRFEAQVLLESRYPAALGGSQLGVHLQHALIRGYAGEDGVPGPHAVLVEALVLLDGWCALAARRASTLSETGARLALRNRVYALALHRISRDWVRNTSLHRGTA